MSTFTTVKDYDTYHRDLASQTWGSVKGLLQRRKWAPISHRPHSREDTSLEPLIVTSRRKRHPVALTPEGTFRKLTVDDIKSALSTPLTRMIEQGLPDTPDKEGFTYTPIVALERADVRKMRSMLLTGGDGRYVRALDAAAKHRVSVRITVLTDLLGDVFWAPSDEDTTDIDVWMDGMGFARNSKGYRQALEHAMSNTVVSPYTEFGLDGESRSIGSAFAGGVRARNSLYYSLSSTKAKAAAAEGLDPILHRRALINGNANTLTLASDRVPTATTSWFEASTPFRLREGKRVNLRLYAAGDETQGMRGDSTICAVEVDQKGRVLVELIGRGRASAIFKEVREMDANKNPTLVMTETPFTPGTPKNKGSGRWLTPTGSTPEDRIIKRVVPTHVVIAGTSK